MMQYSDFIYIVCQQSCKNLSCLLDKLADEFVVSFDVGMEMITIRHFTKEVIQEMKRSKDYHVWRQVTGYHSIGRKEIPLITRKTDQE